MNREGDNLWFTRGETLSGEGLIALKAKVDGVTGDTYITDGKNAWRSPLTDVIGGPRNHKAREPS